MLADAQFTSMAAASRWAALRAAAQLASTVALGDFTAEDDAELSFAKGESLTVLPVVPPEGWLVAKRDDGAQGLVPAITWSTTD